MNAMADLDKKAARTVHTFDIPEGLVKSTGTEIRTIGIMELTAEEEMMAAKRIQGEAVRLPFEQAKESMRYINGKLVQTHDGSADKVWADMHPKIRNMVVIAFNRVHQSGREDLDSFLNSGQISIV